MKLSYFTCIANFGVVPLFLFVAFLLAPALRCFAFLRFSVTAVLDAIKCSSKLLNRSLLWGLFLTFFGHNVKDFICFAQVDNHYSETILLSKGEQKILRFQSLKNFSVGNKTVIAHSWRPHKKQFLIKGSHIGFTDLIIWENKLRRQYKIYVLSNNNFLKLNSFIETLKDLNLDLEIRGEIMRVKGQVDRLEDYKYLHFLKAKYKDQVQFDVHLSQTVTSELIGRIYQQFYDERTKVICEIEFIQVYCRWTPHQNKKIPAFIKQLEKQWGVIFTMGKNHWSGKNFILKMKLIQTEQLNGLNFDLGFGIFKTQLEDLFKKGLISLISNNQVLIQESNLNIKALAEPEIIIVANKKTKIEIGSEIPFQNINTNSNATVIAPITWKFAGLKVLIDLKEDDSFLRLDYSTEFSKPSDNGVSGNKKKSQLYIIPGKAYKIFQIKYQSESYIKSGLPFINKIPLLRNLFLSSTNETSYKLLEGYLMIEEVK